MTQQLGQLSLLVKDYDEAIDYYTQVLDFELLEDSTLTETKRWVRVAPPGSTCHLLLAKAANKTQEKQIGFQAGGRVFLFLYTDDFWRDYEKYTARGVEFIRKPAEESYGTVSVFKDLYGNLWDLIEKKKSKPSE
ncbi:VOC family protein [Algoriphagus hitonicola]|uniref:Catechol 2,3-dioxygenase n=1 Tax=Algoriphagus hitonicola TaxID=435880 RepID=A0A1I2PXX8_9BACT|nr:VOC family protein [Algoriphagus hitonicola]SFG20888.1 Catechol 2,3-dioxygenase [Algoriphagus hitonicola]